VAAFSARECVQCPPPFEAAADLARATTREWVGERWRCLGMNEEMHRRLAMTILDLDLSVRTTNGLEAVGVRTVRDICIRSELELRRIPGFGETSLNELKRKLSGLGLRLGMTTRDLGMRAPED
jgi:DNA-directed RNA polymerase alpha subunit